MVLLIAQENMAGTFVSAAVKFAMLSYHDGASWGLIFAYLILLGVSALNVLIVQNVVMALYTQVDFVQLNAAITISMSIFGGLCLFDEI